MKVTITVKEVSPREERTLEVRRVTTESHKRLTAHSATRVLRREFPDLPATMSASKSVTGKGEFLAMHSLQPTEKCSFHYTWKHYYVNEDTD
ncbi:MAG TPA: hypothetical protein VN310_07580 [Candidatus Dormibacteraeota bacterium]|jgi:hypothetical protein|nr:hypothetical protein [Candidatus Dormibacteraeota bacterium]